MSGTAHPERAPPGAAGFFGKVPGQGDFVSSRFDRALRDPLDRWAQGALAHCRRVRGESWKPAFLAMPPFRFVLGAGLVGGQPAIGVMVASLDRVGRPFPLFLSQRLPGHRGPTRALARQRRWFDDAEALALSACGDVLALNELDRRLVHLAPEPLGPPAVPGAGEADRSFWWTDGPRGGASKRFSATGFPAPAEFDRFLDPGETVPARSPPQEQQQTLSSHRPRPEPARPSPGRPPAPEPAPRPIVSSASHEGTRLRVNSDAVLAAEAGPLFSIAGGRGSLTATPAAARLTVERLARVSRTERIVDLAADAKGVLGNANTLLRRDGGAELPEGGISVVTLALAGDGYAVVWAGDMRCYLLREGMMRGLTRDHVSIGFERRLSRSLGGASQFVCDAAAGALEPGDRFLLASASLLRAVPERDVAARLASSAPAEAARILVEDALVAGVRENVSAVVVALP